MKTFNFEIRDEVGIHARPAGLLVKESKKYESRIIIKKNGKAAEASKLMAVMGLGVKCGDIVQIEVEGADEEAACEELRTFFEKNL